MPLSDVNISKVSGLNREADNTDRITCLVCGGVEVEGDTAATSAPINTLLGPFYSAEDAETRGITAQYDTDNDILVHHHISEFFRGYGESITNRAAKPLYLYMVSRSTPMSLMCDKDEDYGIYQAWKDSNGTIKRFGVVLNPDDAYTADTAVNGFDVDVQDAIAKAQEAAELMHDEHGPVHVYLECRDFDALTGGDAADPRENNAENVSLIIAQDLDVCAINALHEGYAAIGTYLGMVTSKPTLADSPAEVGLNFQGNIQDKAEERFLNYGFGNKALALWSQTTQGAFVDKGLIGVRTFSNTAGVYFTQSYTCAASTSDYTRSELNEIYNKAYRAIYAKYVPLVNTKIRVTADGYIPGNTAKALEERGDEVLRTMANNEEISVGKTIIDPLQKNNAGVPQSLVLTRTLKVKFKMVPFGKMEHIEGELGFTVSIEQ